MAVTKRVCKGCGQSKPLTTKHYYQQGIASDGTQKWKWKCAVCLRKDEVERRAKTPRPSRAVSDRKCPQCGINPPRRPRARYCADCNAAALRRDARRKMEWARARHENVSTYDERLGLRYGIRIPSAPLAAAMNELARQETPRNIYAPLEQRKTTVIHAVCERVGVIERTVSSWASGERKQVNFYQAIEIMDVLDLLWFEVWTDEATLGRYEAWELERVRRLFEATNDRELREAAYMSQPVGEPVGRELVAA